VIEKSDHHGKINLDFFPLLYRQIKTDQNKRNSLKFSSNNLFCSKSKYKKKNLFKQKIHKKISKKKRS